MTKKQKIEFFEAVYKCALGDGKQYGEMVQNLAPSMGHDALDVWNAAFDMAREDIRQAEESLRKFAGQKARFYFAGASNR